MGQINDRRSTVAEHRRNHSGEDFDQFNSVPSNFASHTHLTMNAIQLQKGPKTQTQNPNKANRETDGITSWAAFASSDFERMPELPGPIKSWAAFASSDFERMPEIPGQRRTTEEIMVKFRSDLP